MIWHREHHSHRFGNILDALQGLKFQGHNSLRSVRREGIVLAEFYRLRGNYLVKL